VGAEQQIDNQVVRVTRWVLEEGETTGPHVHEHDYVVIPVVAARMAVTLPDGSATTSELAPGVAYFREAGARHDVSNPGAGILDFVEVEILR
jgi:beta-alanine degradation protein BauB